MAYKNNTLERLRHRIDVYAREESKTEFGELDFNYSKVKTVWAGISVQNAGNLPEDLAGDGAIAQEQPTSKNDRTSLSNN